MSREREREKERSMNGRTMVLLPCGSTIQQPQHAEILSKLTTPKIQQVISPSADSSHPLEPAALSATLRGSLVFILSHARPTT